MAQISLNYGTVAGDGTGDILFDIFGDVETNFTDLYALVGAAGDFMADGSVPMTGAFDTDVGTFSSGVANTGTPVGYVYDTENTLTQSGWRHTQWKNGNSLIGSLFQESGLVFTSKHLTFKTETGGIFDGILFDGMGGAGSVFFRNTANEKFSFSPAGVIAFPDAAAIGFDVGGTVGLTITSTAINGFTGSDLGKTVTPWADLYMNGTIKLSEGDVTFGANDSGGSGYRVLRVPNV